MEIPGSVRDHVPYVPLEFYGETLEACVDTGFNGTLVISRSLAEKHNLKYLSKAIIQTAAGEQGGVAAYEAEVNWLGRHSQVEVLALDGGSVLIGMQLLHEARLEMEPAKGFLKISSP